MFHPASPLLRFLRALRRRPWIWPSLLLAVLSCLAIFAPWFAPQNPWDLKTLMLEDSFLSPSWQRPLAPAPDACPFYWGADNQGRDIFSAVFYGLRISLLVGVAGTLLALAIGVALGLAAGYLRGPLDAFVMRAADIQLSFPSVLIAIFLLAIWGPGVGKIIIAVGLVHWVIYARVVRGQALAEREKDYISAIRALGARSPRIIFIHLLPNLTGPIIVVSAVQFASIVMLEATLSFLGLGSSETQPSLGMLIKAGSEYFHSGYWWIWFFPGLALVLLIVAINWLADLLRYSSSAD